EELKNVSTVANAIKTKKIAKNSVSVVEWLEHVIHPWSAFLVVPIFAFANSGIKIDSKTFELMFQSKVALGIVLGLVIGKPVGILLLTYFTKFSKIGQIPKDVKWHQLLGVGNAAGIGFTVAIFIAKLAFKDQEIQDLAILSVLVASVISALIAVVALKISDKNS
ncbi:MAG: Na+/H+ antiporter NhaA, partial [Candidatus Nanopelagicales bacterium]